MFLDRFLPSGFLRFIGSSRSATLDDYTTLVLGFARIRKKSRLQMGNIAIQLLELIRKRIRLGLVTRFMIKNGRRRRRSVGGTGREGETRRDDGLGVRGNGGGVVARRLWRRFPRLGCGERYGVVLSRVKKLPMVRCAAIIVLRRVSGRSWGIRAPCGLGRRHLGLDGAAHRDGIRIGVEELALLFAAAVWCGHDVGGRFLRGGESQDSRELARVGLGPG